MQNETWYLSDNDSPRYTYTNSINQCAENVLYNIDLKYACFKFKCNKIEKNIANKWFSFLKDCGCKFTVKNKKNINGTFDYTIAIYYGNYAKYKLSDRLDYNHISNPGVFTVFTLIRYLFEQEEIVNKVLKLIEINPNLDPIVCLYLASFMNENTNLGDRGLFSYNNTSLPLIIKRKEFVEYLYSRDKEHESINELFQQNRLNSKVLLKDRYIIYEKIRKINNPIDYKKMLLIFKKYKMLK